MEGKTHLDRIEGVDPMNQQRHLLGLPDAFWFKVQPLQDYDPASCWLPPQQEPGSVGYDMFTAIDGYILPRHRSEPIPLGFKAAFTPGWVGLLLDRSSMGNQGITRFAGVIDPNYRKEWGAILYNSTDEPFYYKQGDKLIQCVFTIIGSSPVQLVAQLPESNRTGGFGSTGK